MNIEALKQSIESNSASNAEIKEVIQLIDEGTLRVAEKKGNDWQVNQWVKQAVMKYFTITEMSDMSVGGLVFRDKIPLKQNYSNVRIVPGGNSVRFGSYLAENVIMMPPSYVNIGAYVGRGSMIDSNVLVGSCAQIGAHVHLSAGVQIGGVLEPVGARPVIIEEGAFIGAGVIVVEGMLVRKNAVLAPGVILTASTRILESDQDGKVIAEYQGEVPEDAIVVPGARKRGEIMLQTPVIIGYKTQKTGEKLELTEFLRSF